MRQWIYGLVLVLTMAIMVAIGGTYQYKDNTSLPFNINLFTCGSASCTSMVLQNSSGTEIMTNANPGVVSAQVSVITPVTIGAINPSPISVALAPTNLTVTVGAITPTPVSVALAATNLTVTVKNANNNGQATMANSSPVVIASDQSAITANATGLNIGQQAMANSVPVVLASNQSVGDPCTFQAKTTTPISTSVSQATIVVGAVGKNTYICAIHTIAGAAVVQNLWEGTGTTCNTGTKAIFGNPTNAASGESYAANGGMTYGSGIGTVGQTTAASNSVCLVNSANTLVGGNVSYVQQ